MIFAAPKSTVTLPSALLCSTIANDIVSKTNDLETFFYPACMTSKPNPIDLHQDHINIEDEEELECLIDIIVDRLVKDMNIDLTITGIIRLLSGPAPKTPTDILEQDIFKQWIKYTNYNMRIIGEQIGISVISFDLKLILEKAHQPTFLSNLTVRQASHFRLAPSDIQTHKTLINKKVCDSYDLLTVPLISSAVYKEKFNALENLINQAKKEIIKSMITQWRLDSINFIRLSINSYRATQNTINNDTVSAGGQNDNQ